MLIGEISIDRPDRRRRGRREEKTGRCNERRDGDGDGWWKSRGNDPLWRPLKREARIRIGNDCIDPLRKTVNITRHSWTKVEK